MINLKKSLFSKIITPVPAELKEQFDDFQLKGTVLRVRVLSLIAFLFKVFSAIFYYYKEGSFKSEVVFSLRNNMELAIFVLFNISIFIFQGKSKKVLWALCLLFVASNYVLYSFDMRSVEAAYQIPVTFSIAFILLTFSPDFRPGVFITFATLFLLSTLSVINVTLIQHNMPIDNYLSMQSFVLTIFTIIFAAKILHYNSVVKTFINTYEINKLNENLISANKEIENQKEELRDYNDNLEEMVRDKTKTIVELKNAVMETIAELVERRDDTTGGHISRTSRQLKIIIDELIKKDLYSEKTKSWNIEQMVMSAQLHDVGKIAIDDIILRKPGKLTNDEFETMKKHAIFGGEIIKEIQKKTGESDFLDNAYIFAVYHHEKWDGTGYPYKIAGEDIPLPARLMAIIDVYDALISERPYKKAFSHEEAIKIIQDGKGTHFDPLLTDLFLSISDRLTAPVNKQN
ncbi:MAG: HD domain-containing protein [Treponema sp.]|jgi:HD-GYP domain-containing protein (c-di-GMP phosphodiesterase class II)|nr:HD domain-containing protein [Treponema sp.]